MVQPKWRGRYLVIASRGAWRPLRGTRGPRGRRGEPSTLDNTMQALSEPALLVAIGQEVLQQGGSLPVIGIVALQAADECGGQRAVQASILAIALFRSAPADVAAEVGVRRADDERLGGAATVSLSLFEPACFVAFRGGDFLEKIPIPHLAEPDGLDESSRRDRIGLPDLPRAIPCRPSAWLSRGSPDGTRKEERFCSDRSEEHTS